MPDLETTISASTEDFKSDLKSLSSAQIFRKYILGAKSLVLSDHLHYQLRDEVCEHFKIDFSDIIVVGSGKLGFSIKPEKRFAPFGESSDIDLAIVSNTLFEKVW